MDSETDAFKLENEIRNYQGNGPRLWYGTGGAKWNQDLTREGFWLPRSYCSLWTKVLLSPSLWTECVTAQYSIRENIEQKPFLKDNCNWVLQPNHQAQPQRTGSFSKSRRCFLKSTSYSLIQEKTSLKNGSWTSAIWTPGQPLTRTVFPRSSIKFNIKPLVLWLAQATDKRSSSFFAGTRLLPPLKQPQMETTFQYQLICTEASAETTRLNWRWTGLT